VAYFDQEPPAKPMFEFYIQYEYWFAACQLTLAMAGMGATLKPTDFIAVVQQPRAMLLGLSIQLVGAPLIAWALISSLDFTPGVAMGIALCAAIPGGTMSNVFVFLARGHVALSIALTAITSTACLITTPLVLGLLIGQHMPPSFDMPTARIAVEISMMLLLPLVLGMGVLQLWPNIAGRFSHISIRLSIGIIVLMALGATGAGRIDMPSFGLLNTSIIALFIGGITLISWLLPRLLRTAKKDITAINIEVTVRNINLALLLKASLFPAVVGMSDPLGDTVLVTIFVYGALALPVGIGQIYFYGRYNKRQTAGEVVSL